MLRAFKIKTISATPLFTAPLLAAGLMLSACSPSGTIAQADELSERQGPFFEISADQNLKRPENYRSWVFVGTPLTPNDLNDGKAAFQEFHNVYIDPVSYDHYKRTGNFRDGTIMMKELVDVGSKAAVSGNGYFMGDMIGLEAAVKSTKHFPNEPGNWAYYSFTDHETGVLADYKKPFPAESCNACHDASAADDFVFTQYYPVLREAKGYGNGVPENNARRHPLKQAAVNTAEETLDPTWQPTAPTRKAEFEVPVDKSDLFKYLKSGIYKDYKYQEKETHPSTGPHTTFGLPVQVYYNDTISASIKAENSEHPVGSAIVKEMFTEDNILAGWAVMVKTEAKSDGGKGWFWYEVTSASDENALQAIGNGVPGCQSCHTVGNDMVRSDISIIRGK